MTADTQADFSRRIQSCETTSLGGEAGSVEALRFYANRSNWTAGRWARGHEEDDDADEPVAGLICVDHQFEEGVAIPFANCGDRARAALAQEPAR